MWNFSSFSTKSKRFLKNILVWKCFNFFKNQLLPINYYHTQGVMKQEGCASLRGSMGQTSECRYKLFVKFHIYSLCSHAFKLSCLFQAIFFSGSNCLDLLNLKPKFQTKCSTFAFSFLFVTNNDQQQPFSPPDSVLLFRNTLSIYFKYCDCHEG